MNSIMSPTMDAREPIYGRLCGALDDLIPLAQLKRTAFYDDVLRPQNIAHGHDVNVVSRPDFKVSINVERSEAERTVQRT